MMVSAIMEEGADPWEIVANTKLWSSDTAMNECLKTLEDHVNEDPVKGRENNEGECIDSYLEEIAWDDVNNIPLPIDLVRKARAEEMNFMKGKIFKVVKKG